MPLHSRPYTLDRIARLTINLILLICAFALLRYLSGVLVPFAVAFLLAYLLNPITNKIQTVTHSRASAVSLTLLLLVLLGIAMLFLFVPLLFSEIIAAKPLLQKISELEAPNWLLRLAPYVKWDYFLEQLRSSEIISYFDPDKLMGIAQQLLQRVAPGMWNIISGTWSVILGLFGLSIIVLYTIFLLIDYERFQDNWILYLPSNKRDDIQDFIRAFNGAMKSYFRGQTMVAGTVGVMLCFGFWLINLPMAISFGLFLGLLNIVPYLQIVGMIPVMLLSVLASSAVYGNFWQLPLLTLIVLGVVQLIQDLFLVPKFVGKETGLRPSIILLSLAVWGKLFGLLGLLVAIPMTCLLLIYYRRIIGEVTQASRSAESTDA